jgi:hypothetical protein
MRGGEEGRDNRNEGGYGIGGQRGGVTGMEGGVIRGGGGEG